VRGRGISRRQILAVVGFGFSCFVLLLYLWIRSGGAVPLSAEKYRVHVLLPQAKGLGPHSDVRVSGVTVGHVIYVKGAKPVSLGRADVLIDLERPYVPLRSDARAMLRGKSIIGEAYVALSLGSKSAPAIAEGGTLAPRNALRAVESDEIFGAYDARTRRALQEWMRDQADALAAHGRDLNTSFASLRPWIVDADRILATVQQQGDDVATLLRDGGDVAGGLGQRAAAIQLLNRAGDQAFNAVGRQGAALERAFRELPGFEVETTRTLDALTGFSRRRTTDVEALRGELAPLSPGLAAVAAAAPPLRTVVDRTPPLASAGVRGLPGLDRVLRGAPDLLRELDPFLRSLNPALRHLSDQRSEVTSALANLAAATQSVTATPNSRQPIHYMRAMPVLNPIVLGPLSQRPGVSRANPYPDGPALDLAKGYPSFDTRACGNRTPYITDDPSPWIDDGQRDQVRLYAFGGKPEDPPRPNCAQQPAKAVNGIPKLFPWTPADPTTLK
jgi:phospholipid/cholesterol/gamma-HCH transport system substrate-binding protein